MAVAKGRPLLPSIDPLTGVYDRATLLSMLFRETDRAQRMNTTLCLLLIAVEVGKGTFPYPNAVIQDELLRQAAAQLSRQLRSYDLLGRVDENTFLAVLPGCDETDAGSLAERIARHVFAKQFIVGCNSIHLTAFFGRAMSKGRSPIVVLREADQALRLERAGDVRTIDDSGFHVAADSMSVSVMLAAPKNS